MVDGHRKVERYPASYDYRHSAIGDLKFALRNEPVDLRILRGTFRVLDVADLVAWIDEEPTGRRQPLLGGRLMPNTCAAIAA